MGGAESARKIRTLAAIINEARSQEELASLNSGASSNQIRPAELVEGKGGGAKAAEAATATTEGAKAAAAATATTEGGTEDPEHADFLKKLSYGEKEAWEIEMAHSPENGSRLRKASCCVVLVLIILNDTYCGNI